MTVYHALPIHKLRQDQSFVYCNLQETAEKISKLFNDAAASLTRYQWKRGHVAKDRTHWAVTEREEHVAVPANEVSYHQWNLGVWGTEDAANMVALRVTDGPVEIEDWSSCVNNGPTAGKGWCVVRQADLLLREQLKPGDCFQYVGIEPYDPTRYVAVNDHSLEGLPAGWTYSRLKTCYAKARVKRIRRYDDNSRVILPCIDPLDELVEGYPLRELLRRYETAQRYERISFNEQGEKHVVCAREPLSAVQFKAAQRAWSIMLKTVGVARARAERYTNICEDVDEMPNMATVLE